VGGSESFAGSAGLSDGGGYRGSTNEKGPEGILLWGLNSNFGAIIGTDECLDNRMDARFFSHRIPFVPPSVPPICL
jgi:hypothetical protein